MLTGINRPLGSAHGQRRLAGQLFSQTRHGRLQFFVVNELFGQTDPIGFFSLNLLGGEDEFFGLAAADQPGQALGAAQVGDEAVAMLQQAQPAAAGDHPDIAGQRHLHARA